MFLGQRQVENRENKFNAETVIGKCKRLDISCFFGYKFFTHSIKPEQIIIPEEKILNYLLINKEKNDKSAFLSRLGFSRKNFHELIEEIRKIATTNEAVLSRASEWNLYKIEGKLKVSVVVTIWIEQIEENKYRFVTLYPV